MNYHNEVIDSFYKLMSNKTSLNVQLIHKIFEKYKVVIFGSSVICSAINCYNFDDYDIIINDKNIIYELLEHFGGYHKIVFTKNINPSISFIKELHEIYINPFIKFQFLYVGPISINIEYIIKFSDLNINNNYIIYSYNDIRLHLCNELIDYLTLKKEKIPVRIIKENNKSQYRFIKYLAKSPIFIDGTIKDFKNINIDNVIEFIPKNKKSIVLSEINKSDEKDKLELSEKNELELSESDELELSEKNELELSEKNELELSEINEIEIFESNSLNNKYNIIILNKKRIILFLLFFIYFVCHSFYN